MASEMFCLLCRYVATDIPSDLQVQVGDVNFHLHKVAVALLRCLKIFTFLKTFYIQISVTKSTIRLNTNDLLYFSTWGSIPCFPEVER